MWQNATVFGHAIMHLKSPFSLRFYKPFFEGFLDTPKIIKFLEIMKVGIYARVSTQEQQTLPLQIKDLREFARRRKWKIEMKYLIYTQK